jgi:nicotinamide-nucleotide amidase
MTNIEETAVYMRRHALLLTTAESCTAGLVAATLADVPGAGQLLDRAYVVYSPEAKKSMLGVRASTIEIYGLTSIEVASEMARGALERSNANVAIGNTGVADGGGNGDDEAGAQCLAWAFQLPNARERVEIFTERRRFRGDRHAIRRAVALYALERLPFYASQVLQVEA